ncbi:DNA repair protein xrcc3 [Allomyces javanicus]|nr:DNA repair protein xrcc3 [Allomyces javanicus]
MTALPANVPARLAAALARANLDTVEDVLMSPRSELGTSLSLSHHDLAQFLAELSRYLISTKSRPARPDAQAPDPAISGNPVIETFTDAFVGVSAIPVSELAQRQTRLATGDPTVDAFLDDGLICPGVTEIAGASGAGKTQLCLQLACQAQRDTSEGGLDGGTMYISTESRFPVERLTELARTRMPHFSTDAVLIETVLELELLQHLLSFQIPPLIAAHRIRLLVVDSLTALFRGSSDSYHAKLQSLHAIARALHKLAATYQLAVIIVNQVSADTDLATKSSLADLPVALQRPHLLLAPGATLPPAILALPHLYDQGTRRVTVRAVQSAAAPSARDVPALPMEWTSAVTTRIVLSRDAAIAPVAEGGAGRPVPRRLAVWFSAGHRNTADRGRACLFHITREGLVGRVGEEVGGYE